MFRVLRKSLDQKKEHLQHQTSVQKKINAIFKNYTSWPIEVIYDDRKKIIQLTTNSKVLASELFFRTQEITTALHQEGVVVRKILIR